MLKGNTKAALRLISEGSRGGLLHLSDIIRNFPHTITSHKDPNTPLANPYTQPPSCVGPITHQQFTLSYLTVLMQRPYALQPYAAAVSDDVCHSLALLTRRICTTFVDPEGLSPLLACRLIALKKNRGVPPIGICEAVRRIIAKAVLTVTGDDIQDAAGSTQLCGPRSEGRPMHHTSAGSCHELCL